MVNKEKEQAKAKILDLLDSIIDDCIFLAYCSEVGYGDCEKQEKEVEVSKAEIVRLAEGL